MLNLRKIELKGTEHLLPNLKDAFELYSKGLSEKGLPAILSGKHFCILIGIDSQYLFGATNYTSKFYRKFNIQTKRKIRTISEPLPLLKEVQSFILKNILYKCETNKCSKAYTPKLSIKSNARLHIGQKVVFNCDVSKFFDNIKYKDVYSLFYSLGYTSEVSIMLAKLCTLDACLPQGAPTSGCLSNLIMKNFDDELLQYCLGKGYRYTRYADDITVSGDIVEKDELKKLIESNLQKLGLKLNSSKTRFSYKHNRQVVTGLVVNEKLSTGKNRNKRLRQELYYISKYGFRGHYSKTKDKSEEQMLERIIGSLSFSLSVRRNRTLASEKHEIVEIYRQYINYIDGGSALSNYDNRLPVPDKKPSNPG